MHRTKESQTWLQPLENFHPYETMLYLGMLGSGLIFLFLALAFLITGEIRQEMLSHRMPVAFLISTAVLSLSGYTAGKIRLYYGEENISKLETALRSTFMLGVIFTVLQFAGWKELTAMGIRFTGLPAGSYLYLLSGIHIFHLVGAMTFGMILLFQLRKTQGDGIQELIWVTNPFEKMRIRLFTVYWHFMDAVWVTLFLIFVLKF